MQRSTERPRLATLAHATAHEVAALREASRRMDAAAMPGTEYAHAKAILDDMIHVRRERISAIGEQAVAHG